MSNDRTKPLRSERARSAARLGVGTLGRTIAQRWRVALPTVIVALTAGVPLAHAGPCPSGQPFIKIPEIVWHSETLKDGKKIDVLRGTLKLTDTQVLMMTRFPPGGGSSAAPPGTPGAIYECDPQTVRAFRVLPDYPLPPSAGQTLPDPFPAPTLRARLGGLVELTFVNQVDPARFPLTAESSGKLECDVVVGLYPGEDTYPDCFHGSSTGNIHFHGTHTNPNGTADNVLLELRPSPRDASNKPTITPETYEKQFDAFFAECAAHLADNPLAEWPTNWYGPNDPQHPGGSSLGPWMQAGTWTAAQMSLLGTSDQQDNQKVAMRDEWPQFYIGAYPYCYQIPSYTGSYPPPSGILQMGQSPGTHWYHAHKHGSTAIDVANGMVGAFIIEGPSYDDEFDKFYGPGWTRSQPVMVINQPGTSPNKMRPGGASSQDKGPDLVVNGRFQPVIDMAPGEVQMWRIVNGSGRSGALLSGLPSGFRFRQIAQDGVQFADVNYQGSENRPILLASSNRADLLVMASTTPGIYPVVVQHEVDPSDLPTAYPVILVMIRVNKDLPPVTGNRTKFIPTAPTPPAFLTNITTAEASAPRTAPPGCNPLDLKSAVPCGTANNPRVVRFASTSPGKGGQHTIDGKKFNEDPADTKTVTLNTVEEWQIENATPSGPNGPNISHPFHIHVNPFQIVEVFDPNQQVLVKGKPAPKYVTTKPDDPDSQCQIDPANQLTWFDCHNKQLADDAAPRVWWDVFPIPSANKNIPVEVTGYYKGPLPGHFRMRSRFVDFPGEYVIHCHILAHEDRGMMALVELKAPNAPSAAGMFHHH
jgi:FtsP/CotA-like multicopper oxidase with cupredoxin domain